MREALEDLYCIQYIPEEMCVYFYIILDWHRYKANNFLLYPSIATTWVTPNITSFSFWSICNLCPKYSEKYGWGFVSHSVLVKRLNDSQVVLVPKHGQSAFLQQVSLETLANQSLFFYHRLDQPAE